MDVEQLLKSAERYFLNKEYIIAMKIYSIVLAYQSSQEAEIGIILSDFGLDYKEEAQVLYYYYQSRKDNSQDLKKMVEQLINSYISELNSIKNIFDLIDADIEFSDGIEYEDFLDIVEDKSNFKEAFEDAIFSTKVIISQKWQFIDFIKKLTENGYYSVALDYLEAHAPFYENDQEILKLYSLLPKGKV